MIFFTFLLVNSIVRLLYSNVFSQRLFAIYFIPVYCKHFLSFFFQHAQVMTVLSISILIMRISHRLSSDSKLFAFPIDHVQNVLALIHKMILIDPILSRKLINLHSKAHQKFIPTFLDFLKHDLDH